MNNYLLDTCFILGLYHQNEQALKLIENISFNQCYVSVINRIELLGYHNITPQDEHELTLFLSKIQQLPLDNIVQNQAIELRKRHKIKLADNLVLATALAHHLTLLTLDQSLQRKFDSEQSFRQPERILR